jgi:hypothetical protein
MICVTALAASPSSRPAAKNSGIAIGSGWKFPSVMSRRTKGYTIAAEGRILARPQEVSEAIPGLDVPDDTPPGARGSGQMSRSKKLPTLFMDPGVQSYELSKIDVAEALIQAAVRLFFEGAHPVPIYALASAAREIMTTVGQKTGIETFVDLLAKKQGVPVKEVINSVHEHAKFFKHADRDPTAKITFNEGKVDIVLAIACAEFLDVTGDLPIEAKVFYNWLHALLWPRITDAPYGRQQELRQNLKMFPGIRNADRKTQKRIGLDTLRRVEHDPKFRMEIRREVKLPSKSL